ncbi:MAG: EamA family transporter [Eubacteriales bacterium]|nr:EamA family transporter [Eubacteriales bacterium]
MTWFILSMITVFFWSGSDFFSKLGSPAEDKYSHWKMVIAVGIVMGLHAAYMVIFGGVSVTLRDFIVYLPASFCYILSMILGYAGLRYIELSISSPVCNSSGAVAAVLCAIFLGQSMLGYQMVAVVLITLGIIFLQGVDVQLEKERKASDPKYVRSAKAIIFPLLYCLIDGLGTFADAVILDGHIDEGSANVAYEFTFLAMAVFAIIYITMIKKEKLWNGSLNFRKLEAPKFIAAISETAGQFSYIYAISANAILAAPLISAYCVLSMVWSRIFLKEKLTRKQYFAIGIAVIGIILLGIGDA